MKKKSLYVAFSENDLELFEGLVGPDDIVIGSSDIITKTYSFAVFDALSIESPTDEYIDETRKLFYKKTLETGIDYKGFANRFFECSIIIVIKYIAAIKEILETNGIAIVIFPKKYYLSTTPNYYLGEHESQGRILYSRGRALQKTILNNLGNVPVKIFYLSSDFTPQLILNLVRDFAVFATRFVKCLKLGQRFGPVKKSSLQGSQVIVVRSLTQFNFIRPLIEKTHLKTTILCGSTYTGGRIVDTVQAWGCGYPHVKINEINNASHLESLKCYAKALKVYFCMRKSIFRVGEVQIDVKQALREIALMSAEVTIYSKQLELALLQNQNHSNCFFTCEQKSPHAYVDALAAKNKGFKCFHLMSCDQNSIDLPYTVFGDYFVVDTLKRLKLFQKSWSRNVEKILYLGPIKSVVGKADIKLEEGGFKYCYFAHASEPKHNIAIVTLLQRHADADKNFSYCIKLHPRDNGGWLKHNNLSVKTEVYRSTDISNEDLFNKFSVGISNPSGVVMDLLCRIKPFIFVDILTSYSNVEFVYCDKFYGGYVNSFEQFEYLLNREIPLSEEMKNLNQRVFGEENCVPSIDEFIKL